MPAWVAPGFARRTGLAFRLTPTGRRFPSSAQRLIHHTLTHRVMQHALTYFDEVASRFGVEFGHPYLDRRLLEFWFAIPSEVRVQHGYGKSFLRRALRDLLPESLRATQTPPSTPAPRGYPDHDQEPDRIAAILTKPEALVFEYVARPSTLRLVADLRREGRLGEVLRSWLRTVAWLELWLQDWFGPKGNEVSGGRREGNHRYKVRGERSEREKSAQELQGSRGVPEAASATP